jgi:CDP-glucose 4,6-dehydratase
MSPLQIAYQGKRVLVTGHTGFKGSWLTQWLLSIGAEVAGYALDPQLHETLYGELSISDRLAVDVRADISDRATLNKLVADFAPEIIFHLAAQPLVRLSYEVPVETFATNVLGTVHLLDAVRLAGNDCAVVCVTTDKCYDNREWLHAYREEDAMGGHDPYSASKGAAELAIASFRKSFFPSDGPIRVASARAGNVIGGGDWAEDRIVPDCIRAIRSDTPITVRNKTATRPWQHVLEPLSGYLWLGAQLVSSPDACFQSAFNFGPDLTSNRTVAELVAELITHTGGQWIDASDPNALHEASKLNLSTDKAFHLLKWQPVWSFEQTIETTAAWYLGENSGQSAADLTQSQIIAYQTNATRKSLPWALSQNQ